MRIPTDTELTDWLKSQHLELIKGPPNSDGSYLHGVLVPGLLYVIASGDTWQEAVIETMKIDRGPAARQLLGL